MSIYENIRFGKINATQREIEEAARQANAHNFILKLPNVCLSLRSSFIHIYLSFRNMKHLLAKVVYN